MKDRIGHACWYKKTEWKGGTLLSWSTDHIEYESGPGHFPVGVIEDSETHQIHSIPVANINFNSVHP